jgi:hypothetical protein
MRRRLVALYRKKRDQQILMDGGSGTATARSSCDLGILALACRHPPRNRRLMSITFYNLIPNPTFGQTV